MNTNNHCEKDFSNTCNSRRNNSFIVLIVLYILLAIIIGSRLY